jgi:hypothetical protein
MDSARELGNKIHMTCYIQFDNHDGALMKGYPATIPFWNEDEAARLITARDRELWMQAQEQIREKAVRAIQGVWMDNPEMFSGLRGKTIDAVRSVPLDPLPSSKEESNVPRS